MSSFISHQYTCSTRDNSSNKSDIPYQLSNLLSPHSFILPPTLLWIISELSGDSPHLPQQLHHRHPYRLHIPGVEMESVVALSFLHLHLIVPVISFPLPLPRQQLQHLQHNVFHKPIEIMRGFFSCLTCAHRNNELLIARASAMTSITLTRARNFKAASGPETVSDTIFLSLIEEPPGS